MEKIKNRLYNICGGIAVACGIAALCTSAPIAIIGFCLTSAVSGAIATGITGRDGPAKNNFRQFGIAAAVTAAAFVAFLPQAKPLRDSIKGAFKNAVTATKSTSAKLDAKTTYVYAPKA